MNEITKNQFYELLTNELNQSQEKLETLTISNHDSYNYYQGVIDTLKFTLTHLKETTEVQTTEGG